MLKATPEGISKFYTLYTLAKQSRNLQAFKLARSTFEKLQAFSIPPRYQDLIDLGSITIRSKPFHDAGLISEIVLLRINVFIIGRSFLFLRTL